MRYLPKVPSRRGSLVERTAAQLLGGSVERARLAVARLEWTGVLRQITLGRRNRAWECVGLFGLLDRFERELGPVERAAA